MYAVIASGGKQHRVEPGAVVRLERFDAEAGKPVEFSDVLVVSDGKKVRVGTPHVDGAKVVGTAVGEGRDAKIIVFKKKRRKGYRRTKGHRQTYTAVRIDRIEG